LLSDKERHISCLIVEKMKESDMSEGNVVIKVESLVKSYGSLRAVDNISFEVRKGEVFAFLGPNGAGKTTTVEILECLREPTDGEAEVLGFDVGKRRDQQEIRKRIGVLSQDFNTFDLLTVRENIGYFMSMYLMTGDPDELIKLVGLEEKTNSLYKHLSGGMKKKLGIAIALVNNPELVFLDEPTTGLDPGARRDVWRIVEDLRKGGKTVFLTTHYMDEAERLADTVAIINRGKIIAYGSPDQLIDRYGGSYTLVIKGGGEETYKLLHSTRPDAKIDSDGDVSVPLQGKSDLIDVTAILSRERAYFAALQVKEPTLEDVFLSLTGRRIVEGELL